MNELLTHEKLFVRVVNAARLPDAHRPQDFELIVTVYHEYILVQGTGGCAVRPSGVLTGAQACSGHWGELLVASRAAAYSAPRPYPPRQGA